MPAHRSSRRGSGSSAKHATSPTEASIGVEGRLTYHDPAAARGGCNIREVKILATQKAQSFDAIVKAGLDPREFTWRSHTAQYSRQEEPELVHQPSGFFFRLLVPTEGYMGSSENTFKFSPGQQSEFTYGTGLSWEYHLAMMREWLRNLKREIAVVDPWVELDGLGSAVPNFARPDAPFAAEEIKVVHSQLDSIAAEIERLQIGSVAEREVVKESLDDLKRAAERVGKKDWYLIFLGTMASHALEKVVAPDTLRSIWALVGNGFHKVLGFIAAG